MGSKVRCKFRCYAVEKKLGWGEHQFHYAAKFQAVTGGSPENESFFASTPAGSLEVSTLKVDMFEPGKDYYLELEVAAF